MICIKAKITGRVQGVGYRAWLSRKARKKGLCGWVMNMEDGSVEALIYGKKAIVEEMLEKCIDGPLASRVLNIEKENCPDIPDTEQGFIQKR